MKYPRRVLLIVAGWLFLGLAGCSHQIAFEELSYQVDTPKRNAGMVAVIDQQTLDKVVTIRAFSTGIAHRWNAQPGVMLKQVADVELPQMYSSFASSTTYREPAVQGVALVLTVPDYRFADWHATFTVNAKAYGANRTLLFDQTYTAEGSNQAGKMVGAGAFGMKSAVRQSSVSALKKIFEQLRHDLETKTSGR